MIGWVLFLAKRCENEAEPQLLMCLGLGSRWDVAPSTLAPALLIRRFASMLRQVSGARVPGFSLQPVIYRNT
jgi:hypothetical protein